MRTLCGAGIPLLDDQVGTGVRDRRTEVDIAAPGFHSGQHDILGEHRHQRFGIGRSELHRYDCELNIALGTTLRLGAHGQNRT